MLNLTSQDKSLLESKGISEEKLCYQLNQFKQGFPFLKLNRAASPGNGIKVCTDEECVEYMAFWDKYLLGNKGKVLKFVPASGAASRMFKDLFEFYDGDGALDCNPFMKTFFSNIHKFAFFNELNEACLLNEGKSIEELISEGSYKTVVGNLLQDRGLAYGRLPKGLLKFHSYTNDIDKYLESSNIIDYTSKAVSDLATTLFDKSKDSLEYIKKAYEYVRDRIPHSADADEDAVTCSASEVLATGHGICFAKAHLLAALLRCQGVPCGFCYQKLILDDEAAPVLIYHGLNGVYLDEQKKWIRLDARGNKEGVNAQFSIDKEQLAFPIRPPLCKLSKESIKK